MNTETTVGMVETGNKNMSTGVLIAIAVVIVLGVYFLCSNIEPFYNTSCIRNVFGRKVCYPPGVYPWYPYGYYPMRHTRMMSYDLRGDPYYIPKNNYVWNNADNTPYWYL